MHNTDRKFVAQGWGWAVRIVAVVWHSYASLLRRAAARLGDAFSVTVYSARNLQEGTEDLAAARSDLAAADLVFIYRSPSDLIWDQLGEEVRGLRCPVVCLGRDPSFWTLSTVRPEVLERCRAYLVQQGEENFVRMLRYLAAEVLGAPVHVEDPVEYPWEGIYHPDAAGTFSRVSDYLEWYPGPRPLVGVLFSRAYLVNENVAVEDALIRALEARGLGVMPVFCHSLRDEELGVAGPGEAVEKYFLDEHGHPRVVALVKLLSFFLAARARTDDYMRPGVAGQGAHILERLGVPVFQPAVSYYRTTEEWLADPNGLGADIPWTVAMPEMEGVIEPVLVATVRRQNGLEARAPVQDRVERLAERVAGWVALATKPVEERRVALILHNSPCASVEATVGGGANLDVPESVARILARMRQAGYRVEVPADGKELMATIMARKAISEFRWTTVEEIVRKGGVLALVPVGEYQGWFEELPPRVKEQMVEAWGRPPGEPRDGVPAAMVYRDHIVVTGVRYGNAVVCVQPKRGCAGARCDGRVCRILHDPAVPPPHQYLATYWWLARCFNADVIVHVGTHGTLEFLPGKGVGISRECYPDLTIGSVPHLYVYNADNPPEGTVAKRRSYAALVDHMQTVTVMGGLYGELAELDRHLEEYEKAKIQDRARAHALEHLIREEVSRLKLDREISPEEGAGFPELVRKVHEVLSVVRSSRVSDGQHVLGEVPRGERLVDFLNAVLRYDAGQPISLRRAVARMMGLDLSTLLADPGGVSARHGLSHGSLLEKVDAACRSFIALLLRGRPVTPEEARAVLADLLYEAAPRDQALREGPGELPDAVPREGPGEPPDAVPREGLDETVREALEQVNALLTRVQDLRARVEASREVDALLRGLGGGYLPPGPAGLIMRGRDDVLPTGRNFYSLDPHRVPTRAAWEVGKRLADKLLLRYLTREGRYPENVAFYWMCNDIMWTDGEGLAQMLYLIGCRPRWLPNGRVAGVEVIDLGELGRPRIDVTVRVSGITRDNFPNCIELLDEAIRSVVERDEPPHRNFVRKHVLASLEGRSDPEAWREATFRIFASRPGTYGAGVNLAVYASAWRDDRDLAEVFVAWNGYAYGKGVFGREAFGQLRASLRSVELTYNKVASDEHDLLGCCCYFGTHGGMTLAARAISGREVPTYYGDTREPEHVEVRTLADEIRRVVRSKLLNPRWIEGQKRHGYKGAADISKQIGRVYGWEATTREVDDWVFDELARTYVLDEDNRRFFAQHNPWALEEIARRMLEAAGRGLWQPDRAVWEGLQRAYLEIEGWLEEDVGEFGGDRQGGAIEVIAPHEVKRSGLGKEN
jgi:cobaltochelatase CobN